MNNLIASDAGAKMTSRDISELLDSRHDSVKRSIERLAESKVIALPPVVVEQFKDSVGRSRAVEVFVFSGSKGKRDSIIVVAQLSPEFTAKLVDRWQELESKLASSTPPIPKTFSEALQLAADQAKKIEMDAPKVNYFDKVVDRDTLLNATQVGQKVGLSAVALNRHLDDLGVYNKAIKRVRAFRQSFVDAGYGLMRQTPTGHAQPMITLSGEAWIIEKLTSEGII